MMEQIKSDESEQDRAGEKRVKLLPRSGSLQAEQRKNKGQQDCARGGEKIEIPIVGVLVGRNILPADDKRDIQVKPPQHQKKEVENAQPCAALRGLAMRLQQEPSEHGGPGKKQKSVCRIHGGDLLLRDGVKYEPNPLIAKP